MPKNKIKLALVTGSMALVGLVAGAATMASAQTSTPTAPLVTNTTATGTVDTPESANDPADTATDVSATSVSLGHTEGQGQEGADDTDGATANETTEGSSTSDAAD